MRSMRGGSSKTRIETAHNRLWDSHQGKVWEEVPVKQGLKLLADSQPLPSTNCMRGGSSKTRIETWPWHEFQTRQPVWEEVPVKQGLKLTDKIQQALCPISMRGGSSKTRIETSSTSSFCQPNFSVWEEVPVKQGLKLLISGRGLLAHWVWEEVPVKQGLKLPVSAVTWINRGRVWEEVPVKQGLKQSTSGLCLHRLRVWEEVPVKQGLKQLSEKDYADINDGMRGGSSKTRIETWPNQSVDREWTGMRGGSSKTRIETATEKGSKIHVVPYERRFQ